MSHSDEVAFELSFMSEPLGLPAEDGYGWAPIEYDEKIGPAGRYTVACKLGWGMHSSTWLALDGLTNKYVAIKILTGYNTYLHSLDGGAAYELPALQSLSITPTSPHTVTLLQHFELPGRMSSASHLCLVMPLYGGDLKAFTHRSSGGALPFPLVRQILFDVLRGLRHAHSRGWIHTDLKRDNIFVENHMSTTEIRRWLEDNPPRRHPLEQSLDCVVQAAVSQPLPVISLEMAMRSTFVLGDFSCAQPVGTEDDVDVTILPLRPPEVILGYPWSGASSDIWSFGCLAFQIVTGQRLFSCGEDPDANSAADALNMLYDMMCITNEAFKRKLLEKAANLLDFFTVRLNMKTRSKTFALKKHAPQITPRPLESCIAATGAALTPADMEAVAALVRRCLRLDPEERPTADVLLSDPIFHGLQ